MTTNRKSTRVAFILSVCLAAVISNPANGQQLPRQADNSVAAAATPHDDNDAAPANAQNKAKIDAGYQLELNKLKDVAAGSIDPCVNAIYIAARDARVQAVLLGKLLNPMYVYQGVRCLDDPGIPEQRGVLFDFNCKPGVFCLVDPNVLVIVDLTTGRVVDIIDPFMGSTLPHTTRKHGPSTLLKGGRATQQVAVTTSGLTFRINGGTTPNPDITVSQGDTVEITYNGTINHDWTLEYFESGTPHTYQAKSTDRTVTFVAERAGTFEYYCSVSDHRERGMHGNFVVNP